MNTDTWRDRGQFNVWVPIEKASESPEGDRIIQGIASTEAQDLQGEVVVQKGLDISYLQDRGFINWEHGKGAGAYIGVPLKAEIRNDGLHVRAQLFKGPNAPAAEEAWKLMKTLQDNKVNRQLGFSIQGKVLSKNGNRIVKAQVHHLALSPQPVNHTTFAEIAKSLAAGEDLQGDFTNVDQPGRAAFVPADQSDLRLTPLLKSRSVSAEGAVVEEFHPIAFVEIKKGLEAGHTATSAGMTGGRAVISEDLEGGKKKKPKVGGKLKVLDAVMKSELTVEEARTLIRKALRPRFPEVTDAQCDRLIALANLSE